MNCRRVSRVENLTKTYRIEFSKKSKQDHACFLVDFIAWLKILDFNGYFDNLIKIWYNL